MDYFKHYTNLINRARSRDVNFAYEQHHIWPKSLHGPNEQWNIVKLTPEEHYVAHQLLVKLFPNEPGLIWAAYKMTMDGNGLYRQNNKLYGWLKRKYQQSAKRRIGQKNPSYGKHWYYDPETLQSSKFEPHNVPKGWLKGRVLSPKNNFYVYCKSCNVCLGLKTHVGNKVRCSNCANYNKQFKQQKRLPTKRYWFLNVKTLEERMYSKNEVPDSNWIKGRKTSQYVNYVNKQFNKNFIQPKQFSKINMTKKILFKEEHPTWDEFEKAKEKLDYHINVEKLSYEQIKNLYDITHTEFGKVVKTTFGLT